MIDMTSIFEALYTRFKLFDGEDDPYTITSGRLFRTQAPPGVDFPIIVVQQTGGSINEMFSGESLDNISLQMSVFDEYRNDATRASKLMRNLVDIYNWQTLPIPDADEFIRMKRDGLPTETIEDMSHIHIYQDWTLEHQVPTIFRR